MSATVDVGGMSPVGYVPWFDVIRMLHLTNAVASINTMGYLAFMLLALILLWRILPGPLDFPAVSVALSVTLAWLVVSPQQRPWYDAMIFPLMCLMPPSRLDLLVVLRSMAGALANLPRPYSYAAVHPTWLARVVRLTYAGSIPFLLAAIGCGLLWLCITNDWRAALNGSDRYASWRSAELLVPTRGGRASEVGRSP